MNLFLKVFLTMFLVLGALGLLVLLANTLWWFSERLDEFLQGMAIIWVIIGGTFIISTIIFVIWTGGNICAF